MEPAVGAGVSYMIYQAYFVVPGSDDRDFKRFYEIRDTTNNAPIDYWTVNRVDLSVIDAERTIFDQPSYAVPYETDSRGQGTVNASATLGYMMYELWPHPLSQLPYTMSWLRRGPLLSAPSDTIPSPLTEDMVKWRTREAVYIWKESQKGDGVARGAGADWKFLAGAANAEYQKAKKRIGDRDRDLVELYFRRFVRDAAIGYTGQPFATITNGLNVGRF
jgi:hypothetical protein